MVDAGHLIKKQILILFWLLACGVVTGTTPHTNFLIEKYDQHTGLSHPSGKAVCCDSNGYTWIGTSEGLYRFNGVWFDYFSSDENKPDHLMDGYIESLYEDSFNNCLWVGTGLGVLSRIDLQTFQIKNYQFGELDASLEIQSITSIARVDSTRLFIGTNGFGAYLFDYKLNKIQKFEVLNPSQTDHCWYRKALFNDHTQMVATNYGLIRLDVTHLTQQAVVLPMEDGGRKDKISVRDILQIDAQEYYLTTSEGVVYYHNQNPSRNQFLFSLPEAWSMAVVNEELYVGSLLKGIHIFNRSRNSVRRFEVDPMTGFQQATVFDIHYSKTQNILWIGSSQALWKVDFGGSPFHVYDVRQLSDVADPDVYMLLNDQHGGHWFWTLSGLFYRPRDAARFQQFSIPGSETLSGNLIDLVQVSPELIAMGSYKGVLVYRLTDGEWTEHVVEFLREKNTSPGVMVLCKISDQVVAATYRGGFVLLNVHNGSFSDVPLPSSSEKHFVPDIFCMEPMGDSVLWVGTSLGAVHAYDLKAKRWGTLLPVQSQSGKLGQVIVTSLKVDHKQRLWIGTFGAGLIQYDIREAKISYDFSRGLLKGNVYEVVVDHKNRIWANSNHGIVCLQPEKELWIEFDHRDEIFCSEFNQGATHQASDGTILMGGQNGYIAFHPDSVFRAKPAPRAFVSSYSFVGDFIAHDPGQVGPPCFVVADTLVVPAQVSYFYLRVSVNAMTRSHQNKIRWKLNGYDDKWHEANSEQRIFYGNLRQGTYELEVYGSNDQGIWSEIPAKLTIVKKQYLYQRAVFWLILMGALLVLFYLFYTFRTRLLKNQKKNLLFEVNRKNGELTETNRQLLVSQKELLDRNRELDIHRNYLEELVAIRTHDLESAKEKAEKADHLKSAFLANLSHEIRTPMNAIVGFSNLLGEPDFSEAERQDFIKLIQQSSDTLLILINDILDISRIEAGQVNIVRKSVEIRPLLLHTYKSLLFERAHPDTSLRLIVHPNLDHVVIHTDPERLRQVLVNLITNALKFTPKGLVMVQARKIIVQELPFYYFKGELPQTEDALLLVEVMDEGIGISEFDQQLIFRPFTKISNSIQVKSGLGLGLSIVFTMLKLLGGQVWVRSEKGKGASFYFYLPIR